MSALAGIFNFNNKPIREAQREEVATLWHGLGANGPDSGDLLFEGSIGMCYRAIPANEESRGEIQPLLGRHKTILVADLRLDNREELLGSLPQPYKIGKQVTDAELVLAAYEKWGEMFPLHLVGDFALMLFDGAQQRVLLARDHIGARPLFYHYNSERLICSSQLGPLLEVAGISLEINDEFVAGYLMYDPEPELTAYKHIHSVKPFHVLTFTADGKVRERPYWDLAAIKPLRHKNDADYEEEFRFHFKNAVRGPLRTDRPVFSDLSGGLDSSSIVCQAHQLIQNSEVQARELFTISLVSSDSPTSDQAKYIRYVEEHIGRAGFHIDQDDAPLFSTLSVENALPNLNALLFCEAKHGLISRLMQQANSRVLLCGVGGDEITCAQQNPAPELSDLVAGFNFITLHERLKVWSNATKRPYLPLLRDAVKPLLPDSWRWRREMNTPGIIPDFLTPAFVSDFSLRRRHVAKTPFACSTPSGDDQALGFWTAIRGIAVGYRQEMTRGDISYPFLARPLVEFMQAIPHTQRVQVKKSRYLMRRALKDLLPAGIVKRRGKGNPQETIVRAFTREWPRLKPYLEDGRIASHGYVRKPEFLLAIEGYRLGKGIYLAMLLKLLSLEFWLRRLESVNQPATGPIEDLVSLSYQKPAHVIARAAYGPNR